MNKTRLNRNTIEQSKVVRFLVLLVALLLVCNGSAQTAAQLEGADVGQAAIKEEASPQLRNVAQQVGAIYRPQKISNVRSRSGNDDCPNGQWYLEFTFGTDQATVPIINVLKRPPDSHLNFQPSNVVSSAFPVLNGKQTQHKIRVQKLRADTQYYYVITAGGMGKNDRTQVTGKAHTDICID